MSAGTPDSRVLAGKYRILGTLGSGGAGTVLEVEHLTLPGRRYAAKLLHEGARADPRTQERLLREAQLAATLDHPSIVAIHDVERDPERGLVIVMEKLEGAPLAAVLAERRLTLAEVQAVGCELLEALAHAHELEVVHRDIKPGNIMVARQADGSERLKLVDFGIAGGDTEATLTGVGEVWGTPRYASPEHLKGLHAVTASSDLFSVGVTLFVARCGHLLPLVMGATSETLRAGIARGGLPEPWRAFFERALALDPAERFPSAAVMGRAMAALPVEGEAGPLLGRSLALQPDLAAGYPQTWTGALTPESPWAAGSGGDTLADGVEVPLGARTTRVLPGPELPPPESPRPRPRRRDGSLGQGAGGEPEGLGRLAPWVLVGVLGALLLVAVVATGLTGGLLLSRDEAPPRADGPSPAEVCRMWARALAEQQHPDGGFSGIPQAAPSSWDTAQQLSALVAARDRCGAELDEVVTRALDALAAAERADGWAGGATPGSAPETLTVATAWTLDASRRALPASAELHRRAGSHLGALQREDGTFPWHRSLPEGDRTHPFATVVAAWALGETGELDASEARRAAGSAVREAWTHPGDPWSLRATAGLDEQAYVALRRHGVLEGPEGAARSRGLAERLVARCALEEGACTRASYEHGSVTYVSAQGEELRLVTQWLPWAALATADLLGDEPGRNGLSAELQDQVETVDRWLLDTLVAGGETWAGRPGYELAEHLLALAERVEGSRR